MRTLFAWLVVPSLLVVAAACVLVAWTSSSDRASTEHLTRARQQYDQLLKAQSWAENEVEDLIGLDAFSTVPPDFDPLVESARSFAAGVSRGDVIDDLFASEASAGPVSHDLGQYLPLPPVVQRVLRPLEPGIRQRLQSGDEWFVAPDDYVQILRWFDGQMNDAQQRADEAGRALIDLSRRPPYWRTWEFGLIVAGLVAFALSISVIAAWRVSATTRRLGELHDEAKHEAAAFSARADQLQSLIALGRRLSSDAEADVLSNTIVSETRAVLGPDPCVLALLGDGKLVPAAFEGGITPSTVSFRDGVVGQAAETGMSVRTVVARDPMFEGAGGPLAVLAMPLVHDGRVAGVLAIARDASRPFEANDEVVLGLVAMMSAGSLRVAERYGSTLALALDDPLTGLGNRRRLDRDLGEIELQRGNAVSFLMIDIDFFKQFNDCYGHPAGDALLRAVGETIASTVRVGDIAYRFGGEEFSVLLPATDGTTALGIAERIRAAVAMTLPPAGGTPVTVSVGVSVGNPATSNSRLIDEADRALYDAKRSGRDRVTFAGAFRATVTTFAPPTPSALPR